MEPGGLLSAVKALQARVRLVETARRAKAGFSSRELIVEFHGLLRMTRKTDAHRHAVRQHRCRRFQLNARNTSFKWFFELSMPLRLGKDSGQKKLTSLALSPRGAEFLARFIPSWILVGRPR